MKELTDNDIQRIEQEAQAHATYDDQFLNGDYMSYKEGYTDATMYERQKHRELEKECFHLAAHQCNYPAGDEGGTPYCYKIKELEAERSELIEYNNNLEKTLRICLTVKPHTESVDAMKAMVKTLLENSQTK